MTLLCKDCKWHKPNPDAIPSLDQCMSPKLNKRIDFVTGEESSMFCAHERIRPNSCGKEGKFFEQKEEEFNTPFSNFLNRLFS